MKEVPPTTSGLHPELILSSIVYTFIGIFLMVISIYIFDKSFKLNVKKELFTDHNTAFGIVLAGASIAIAIIIAAAIS